MKHTKMYLSVAQARGWDGPVGDPFGGPAYGERNMPVIAVAMAASSFAAGAAAFAAGTATFMTGLSMVASALTIVGTVTGNPKLAMIGGVLSLGASIASGGLSNMFSSGGGEAATAAAADVAGGLDPAFGSSAAYDAVVSGGGAAMSGADLAGAGAAGGGAESLMAGAGEVAQSAPGAAETMQPSGQAVDAAANPYSTTIQDTMATPELSRTSAFETNTNPIDADITANSTLQPGLINSGGSAAGGGFFDSMGKWVEKNPTMAKMGLGALQGAIPNNETKARTNLTKAQEEAIRQRTEEERTRALWRRGLINN